jgi:bacterioferritin (cytochrome b1)
MAEGQTLSHRWMRVLDALRPDARRILLHRLEEDYREELVAAERLTADARGVRAAHLRHKLDDISEAEREHARSLREAIVGLGGVLPGPTEAPAGPRPARTFLRLLEDLEAEKSASADYLRTAGVARRAGETGVEALLARIRADEERHARELVDILERLDPNA